MKPYKSCSCRDPKTGRLLGKKCPDLGKKGHGKWYARYEAPRTADGRRRQPRVGPYDTEKECKAALVKVLGTASGHHLDDRKLTLGDHLERRYKWRLAASQAGGKPKPSTLAAERETIDLYLKPGLGHVKLVDLRDHHVQDLYAAMRLINRPAEREQRTELLRRLLEARATRDGRRLHTRPLSESRIKRVHAVLTGALNAAVGPSKPLDANPADGIFENMGDDARAQPLLWTAERVEEWERTGEIPSKVMVWTAPQTGAFLDFTEATDERLYALYHLDAYWGPRRGELANLDRTDLSLDRRRLSIRAAKSKSGVRQIVFDEGTEKVLRAWRKRQSEERLAWGEAYRDSGRVFTYEDGRALRPAYVSQRFELLIERYAAIRKRAADGWPAERIARKHRVPVDAVHVAIESGPLPPIRFHDLRHGAATALVATGAPDKLVAEVMGHASASFTHDVYAVVADQLAEQAATAMAAFVPRRNRGGAAGAINVPSGGGK